MEKIIRGSKRSRTSGRGTEFKTRDLKPVNTQEMDGSKYPGAGNSINPDNTRYKQDEEHEVIYSTWFIAGHNLLI